MELIRKAAAAANSNRNKRIKLNVGGAVFETWTHTLQKKPGTRLAKLSRSLEADESYDTERGEYFFDRHPGIFSTVMHYYRTDELHTDHNICGNIIKGELEFWGLTELDIEPCCWGHYNRFKENKETLAAIDDSFTFRLDDDAFGEKPNKYMQFKKKVWIFLEDPASSRGAKIYAVVSMFFVLLSIGVFCLETHPLFRVPNSNYNATATTKTCEPEIYNNDYCCCRYQSNELKYSESDRHVAMAVLDYLCAAFFTFEYIARIYFAPKKILFLRDALNIIDVLCLVPHFVSIIINIVDKDNTSSQVIRTVLALRIIRVLRIFKLMKHYTAFKILVYTIKVSTKELLLMVIFLFNGVLIFASVMFFAENDTFTNIPIAFWWSLVTMTTVGYGDKVPRTEWGYLIGSLCVLCGVLTVAFTVPIVVNNFTLYYSHAQSRVRLPQPKREELQKKLILKNQKAQEFIKKLTVGVKKNKELGSVATPRNIIIEEKKENSPSIDSGLEECTTPTDDGHRKLPLVKADSTSTTTTTISDFSHPRVQTVSAAVAELDMELPGTPASSTTEEKTARQIETAHLLNTLEDQQEKMAQERRRQLTLISFRREQRLQARNTPRSTPSPAVATQAPPAQVPAPPKSPIQPTRPSAAPPASTRPAHSFVKLFSKSS